MIVLALGGGSLIPILIFIAFAILSQWLKKKAGTESAEDYSDLPRGPQPPRPRPQRKSWEEELREALENRSAPPPITREVPPPVIYTPQEPVPVSEQDEGIKVFLPSPPPLAEARFEPLAGLSESERRYEHASQLHERVARQLHDVTQRRVATVGTRETIRSETANEAIQLVRNPRQLRAAIVANIILGPPRALQEI